MIRAMSQLLPFAIDDSARPVLARLTAGLQSILRERLVGFYLYGSLITGDFDAGISDIDLVVVMTAELDSKTFESLHRLHQSVVERGPEWHDRLELAYISQAALRAFRSQSGRIGIISPGEPFHLLDAGKDWLISWHKLREDGVAVLGPPIQSLIDEISTEEYLEAVAEHICGYRESVQKRHNKQALSYIVLTVARGLYTLRHSQATSKIKAATWAQARYPQWASLLERAWAYRADPHCDSLSAEQIRPEVAAFVHDALAEAPCAASSLACAGNGETA